MGFSLQAPKTRIIREPPPWLHDAPIVSQEVEWFCPQSWVPPGHLWRSVFPKMENPYWKPHNRDVKKEMGELIDPQVSTLNRRLVFSSPFPHMLFFRSGWQNLADKPSLKHWVKHIGVNFGCQSKIGSRKCGVLFFQVWYVAYSTLRWTNSTQHLGKWKGTAIKNTSGNTDHNYRRPWKPGCQGLSLGGTHSAYSIGVGNVNLIPVADILGTCHIYKNIIYMFYIIIQHIRTSTKYLCTDTWIHWTSIL